MTDPAPGAPPGAMTMLRLEGDSPEAIERRWLAEVYQPGAPQLTVRAVLTGSAIGAVMCLSNLYVSLKTGLAMGVAVTACVLAYALPRVLGQRLSMLECNAAQSVASSAGYATGGTLASAAVGYLLVTGHHPPLFTLLLWTLVLAALGVFFAIPMKRRLVNVEQLPFPTGTAAAQTLRSLYSRGAAAAGQARWLAGAGGLGAVVAIWRDGFAGRSWALPTVTAFPGTLGEMGFAVEGGVLLLGAGALVGLRLALSMLAGAIVCWGLLAPRLPGWGAAEAGPEAAAGWAMWPGAALLATSALVSLALSGGSIRRALSRARGGGGDDPLAAVEVPRSWFRGGVLVFGAAAILLGWLGFGIPPHLGAVAVAMSFLLCLVACRVTGETDATPSGPLGQVTQLAYGVLMPQDVAANLVTASITGNTSAAAADLLSDLKSGWLVGANPRRQFLAQLLGALIGSAIVVPFFLLLVPAPGAVGPHGFAAPAGQVLAGMARLLAGGFASLHPSAVTASAWAAAAALFLSLAESRLPARLARFIPSPTGIGLAFLIPASSTLSMLAGAILGALWIWRRRERGETEVTGIASGLIAGESVAGVALALLSAAGLRG